MLLIATGSGDFYRINADGTDARQLGDSKVDRFYPTWSPDGMQIAFVFGSSTGGFIHVMDADGRFETQIGKSWGGATTWSPDGSRLAYVVRVEEPADIFVATRAGAEWTESLVVGGPTDDRFPAWSNDGTRLAFLRMDADGQDGQLMVVPAIGGVERVVPTGPGKLTFARMCWTPDDRSIVALSLEPDAAYVVAPADGVGPPLRIDTTGINSVDNCGFQRLAR